VGVALLVAIVAGTGFVAQMQRLAAIEDFRTFARNLGKGMATQTAQSIAIVDQILTLVATSGAAPGDAKGAAGSTATDANLRLRSLHDAIAGPVLALAMVDSLLVADADGRVVGDSNAWPAKSGNVSEREYFRHLRNVDERSMFIDTPALDRANGRRTVAMARRIDDPHGRFAGIVVAEFSLTGLEQSYRVAMPPNRSVSLARRDGVILMTFPHRDDAMGQRIPGASPWYATRDRGGGVYIGPGDFDSTRVLASVHLLGELPLVVEASVTEAFVLQHWQGNVMWTVLAGIAAATAVVVLLVIYARQYERIESSEQSLTQKNREIEAAHDELNETLANLSQGVCLYGKDKKLLVFNQRFCWLYDLQPGTVQPGMTKEDIARLRIGRGTFPNRDLAEYLATIDQAIRERQPLDAVDELPNGKSIAFHFQPLPGRRWLTTHEDITQRVQAEARVSFLARHDFLTGLANRISFKERLESAFEEAKRGKSFAIMCLDLDRFKAINDSFGHPVGDALLRSLAERLLAQARKVDIVARLGGDEFAILLPGLLDASHASVIAQRIIETVKQPFEIEGHRLMAGMSIGIVMSRGGDAGPAQLMKDGDRALYLAKGEGRGTWRLFEESTEGASPA
jgi:diguanylate cyclase (GGDEF)-like protein